MFKIAVFLFALLATLAAPQFVSSADDTPSLNVVDPLLETGTMATEKRAAPPAELKVVSYNIRWRGGDELRKLIDTLKTDVEIGGAEILGLQEVDRNKKRTKHENTIKRLASELGMYYAWAAPPSAKAGSEEETGVAILSKFPLTDVRRLVLPHPGPGERRRAAIGATVNVGQQAIRVYSVHAETRLAMSKKLEQMKAVLNDLAKFPEETPAIIVGDLNTWEPGSGGKTSQLFRNAGFQTPFNGDATFCQRIVFVDLKLKLDWVWLRGFEVKSSGLDRSVKYSDHWPLWTILKLSGGATEAAHK